MNNFFSVAIVSPAFFPEVGGAQVTVHNLARYMHNKGHSVILILPFGGWWRIRKMRRYFDYKVLPMLPFRCHLSIIEGNYIWWLLQKVQFSIFQFIFKFDIWQSIYAHPTAILVKKFTSDRGLPHILRCVGDDIQTSSNLDYGVRQNQKVDKLVSDCLRGVDNVVALSDSVRQELLSIGVKAKNIINIPCGVNLNRFQEISDKKSIRAKYSINENSFCFICVGRNHPKKGFEVLLNAMKLVLDAGYFDASLVFVGTDMESLKKLSKKLQIEDNIIFTGELGIDLTVEGFDPPSSDLVRLYKACDACAFPSLLETFAMVYIEAMSAQIPVIGTDAPGCHEILEDGINGLVSVAGDSASLSEKMIKLMNDKKLQKTLIKNGNKTVYNLYRWEVVGKTYEDTYWNLINRK